MHWANTNVSRNAAPIDARGSIAIAISVKNSPNSVFQMNE